MHVRTVIVYNLDRPYKQFCRAEGSAPLVIEAVVEDMAVKSKVFGDLEGVVASEAVLATNTSSLSVVGMHFFNPVPAMRLVEVVTGPSTDSSTVSQVEGVAERLGRTSWPSPRALLPRKT